jgi:hypothetical protein
MGLGASYWPGGGPLADRCQDQADVAFLLRYDLQGSIQEDGSIGAMAMTP